MRRVIAFAVLAGCPTPGVEPQKPQPTGDTVPELIVNGPERGTFVDGGTVVVSGRVRDDGAVRVTVNGVAATVSADGAFTAELAVPRGLTIVETHAIDTTGHDVRDVRAVLAGPFATSDGKTRAPLGVRFGRAGLAALGKSLAKSASAIDFGAAVRAANPVFEKGGCLGVKVDVSELAVGKVDMTLVPQATGIDTMVAIDDIVAKLDLRYQVACLGGSASVKVRTRARARGELGATLVGRNVQTSLRSTVALDDFQIDIAIPLPRPVEAVLRTGVRLGVERALAELLQRKLPALADAKLAELLATPIAPAVLGKPIAIEVVPRKVQMSAQGLDVGADASIVVAGGERGRYVATPVGTTRSESQDLGVWLAADAINQLLAGLWTAKAFDRTVAIDDVGPLKFLLDGSIKTIEVALALPPTITTGAAVELAIGDLSITMRDAAGAEVQRFAVSLRSALSTKKDALVLTTGEPIVYAQLLAQRAVDKPLDRDTIERIVKGSWALVDNMLGDALSRVPVPGFTGIEARSLTARDGLILLDVAPKP